MLNFFKSCLNENIFLQDNQLIYLPKLNEENELILEQYAIRDVKLTKESIVYTSEGKTLFFVKKVKTTESIH